MSARLEIPVECLAEIEQTLAKEKNAHVVRWLMGIRLVAMKRTTRQAAEDLAVSDREVRRWVNRFLVGGIDAMRPRWPTGNAQRLPDSEEESFKERIRNGPTPEDGFSTWRGPFIQEMLRREFGVSYARSSVYTLLHRLGLASLMPRPQHPGSSPEEQERFQKKPCRTPIKRSAAKRPGGGSKSGSRTRRASASRAP